MQTRNSYLRAAAAALSAAVLIFTSAGCGGTVVRPESIPAPSSKTLSEVFTEGAKRALLDAVQKSERLSSAQLDIMINPGAQINEKQSSYTKSTVSITDPQDSQNNLGLSIESSLDAATGDSSFVTSIQAGYEIATSGGIYFIGNSMLIRKSDPDQPMIQHTLDAAIATSYKSLPAIERFARVLSDTANPKMNETEWETSINAFLRVVVSLATETDYVSEPQAVSLAGTSQDCTATTLTLTGNSASTAVSELVSLIAQDASFKALFIPQYLMEDDTYGITGLDGVLRDIRALTPEKRNALVVTFKTLQNEKTSALYLGAVTEQRSMSILFKFFEDGSVRENDIVFTGFDGGGVKMIEQNASAGGDNYTGRLIYEQTAPGGVLQEQTEVNTASVISSDSYSAKAQFKYTRAAYGDMGALDFSGTVDYSQKKTEQGTSGVSTGTLTSVSGGETTALNLSLSLDQQSALPQISAPQFIPAAGISTSDEASLFAALNDGFEADQFRLAPASVRITAALLLVLF